MRYPILGLFVAWLYYNGLQTVMSYSIPEVKLEVLQNGFRVSIPHESGVENVAFNINRNRPFSAFEQGEFSDRIRTLASDKRWSADIRRSLEDDDVIYIWVDVQFNKSHFRTHSPPLPVRQIKNGATETTITHINTTTNTSTTTKKPPVIHSNNDKCEASLTVTSSHNVCKGQLIFEDNFESNILNMSLWRYEVRLPLDIADAEFVLYDTNAEVSNGLLKIKPKLWGDNDPNADIRRGHLNLGPKCTANQNPEIECQRQPFGRIVLPPVVSARINTKHAFSFKYGRIEVRAKLPKGDWLFPLLLLEPMVNYYGQRPYASGQMRIAFLRSNLQLQTCDGVEIDGRVLYGGAILSAGLIYRDIFMVNTSKNSHFGDTFHTYSLTWNNRHLSLDVDGQNYGIVDGGFAQNPNGNNNAWPRASFMAPLDQEFFITIGVAAGGHNDFPDVCVSKPWTNTSPKAALDFWRNRHIWKPTWTSPALEVDYGPYFLTHCIVAAFRMVDICKLLLHIALFLPTFCMCRGQLDEFVEICVE